ncbi:MAG: PqiC family protein, partial [Mariprofundales bacterium]|nr:PqiC family protein [Mariprofundales bacterium]
FVLTAPASALPTSHPNLSVEVNELRLPKYLDRPQIVSRSSANQLNVEEHNQWAGKLRDNMMRMLAKNLSNLLGSSQIVIAPYRPSEPSAVRVMVEILRFERMADGVIYLDAQWRLSSGRDSRSLVTRISHLQSGRGSSNIAESVEEMSTLFAQFSREIAVEIVQQLSAAH